VDDEQILAFRLARSGLAERRAATLAGAAACPASDFSRDAALLALAARAEDVSAEAYRRAVDAGELVVAHVVRGAIHALAPADFGLYGRALIATDDDELGAQLGRQVRRLGISPVRALAEVAAATRDALDGRALDKNALHDQLRSRVSAELMPWCRGCGSHHVAPMLWRYATVAAGVRLDAQRRYLLGEPGDPPPPAEAVRRFLRFYGPATPAGFAEWAGLARPHAKRLWDGLTGELVERDGGFILREDESALDSPPAAHGVRLLPPGDPYLQLPNRPLLARDPDLRKRLFRPVASPGAVLSDGRLAGLWRATKDKISVEELDAIPRAALEEEAQRVAELRDTPGAALVVAA
jgi:Winged helix DNA-binding domain